MARSVPSCILCCILYVWRQFVTKLTYMLHRDGERGPAREIQRDPEREPQRATESHRDFLWLSLARCPAHSGSLWLAVRLTLALSGSLSGSLRLSLALSNSLALSLAPSGSLRLSLPLYCSPNLLTKPLLGSQGSCSARNAVPEFQHFNQPCFEASLLLATLISHLAPNLILISRVSSVGLRVWEVL